MSDQHVDVPINLPWNAICKIACQARIHNTDFNTMCNYFLKTRMQQLQQERRRGK